MEQISTTFTRNELIELRLLLNEMMEIKNNNRAGAVTPAETYTSYRRGGGIVPKDTYIRIRLTAGQKEQIKEAAKRSKTNMSDFVLTATRNTIEKGDK